MALGPAPSRRAIARKLLPAVPSLPICPRETLLSMIQVFGPDLQTMSPRTEIVCRSGPKTWIMLKSVSRGHIGRLGTAGSSFLAIALLLGAGPSAIAGQTDPSQTAGGPAVEAHFAVAQEAQKNSDYATAHPQYRPVLTPKPHFPEFHINPRLIYHL